MEIAKIRQSNFELLRIISMAMIIGLHYLNDNFGGALKYAEGNNNYISHLLESLFIVGVNCFVLITGYFMINKSKININKLVKLMISLLFYSLLFYVISIVTGQNKVSLKEIVLAIVPFLGGRRWFIETYMILFLLIPFLNVGLKIIDKKKYNILLILMLVFFSIWSSFLPHPPVTDNGYGIVNFVLLYCIGGYIRLHWDNKKSIKTYIFGYIICGLIVFASSLVPYLQTKAWGYNYIFNIIGSVCLFLIFSKINIQSKIINLVSPCMLGVFIIHTDTSLMKFIYQDLGQCFKFWNSPYLIIHIFVFILIMLATGILIDMTKEKAFKKIIYPIINKIKIFNLEI